jgi:hypothetical protein
MALATNRNCRLGLEALEKHLGAAFLHAPAARVTPVVVGANDAVNWVSAAVYDTRAALRLAQVTSAY